MNQIISKIRKSFDGTLDNIITRDDSEVTSRNKYDTTSTIDIYNFKIIQKMNTMFSLEEKQLYIGNLYLYIKFHPTNDYVINLEEYFDFIGYSSLGTAKRTLEKNFIEDEDYQILLCSSAKQVHGGHNKETIMLNTDTFKSFCMLAPTSKGKKIRKYYVKLEHINNEITTEQLIENQEKLKQIQEEKKQIQDEKKQIQDENKQIQDENKQILINSKEQIDAVIKEKELIRNELVTLKELKYIEISKDEILYIFSTDIPGVYKIGKTKRTGTDRKKDLQTGCINDIDVLFEIHTNNSLKLETIVHDILHKYHHSREYFRCDLEYIKIIVTLCRDFLHTMKSSHQVISEDELLNKLNENMGLNISVSEKDDIPKIQEIQESSQIKENNVYEQYITNNILITNNENDTIQRANLYDDFIRWCRNQNMNDKYTHNRLGRDFKNIFKTKELHQHGVFVGIKYKILM